MSKMSKAEYQERKARLDAGEGSDDDRRLVELYAQHFEDSNLEDAVVHTSEQQTEKAPEGQVMGITGTAEAEVVKGGARKSAPAKKATQGQRQNGTN